VAETSKIALMATKLSEELFSEFFWSKVGPEDQNWPCEDTEHHGLGLEHALSVRVYLTHFDEDYTAMNAVYASHFASERQPARTCIGVTGLAKGARIEIDLVARRYGVPVPPDLAT
jgi:hypothetical protein